MSPEARSESKRQTHRPLVLAAMMLAMFMAAIEATIVATAMPTIVTSLGGFSLYGWVFSVFLLAQAATIPLYGRLADLYGRKPVLTAGVLLFLAGSLLAGFAGSMVQLILFRGIQGAGAGAIMPIAVTIIGDLYTLEERARIQGYLSSVWGISALIGPAVGGFIVQYWSWPWVFFINVPVGVLALLLTGAYLHENVERKSHRLDYPGVAWLLLGTTALLVALLQGGVAWSWFSLPSLMLLLTFAVAGWLFIRRERRAPEPLLPLDLFENRVLAVADLAVLVTGAMTLGVSSFIPTFVQGVLGESPTVAGFSLTMMSVGWPLAATVVGHAILRFGYRSTALAGKLLLVGGTGLLISLGTASPVVLVGIGTFIIGLGQGLTSTTYVVAVQSVVPWNRRGIATGSNSFMRLIGSTFGVALLGGVLNARLLRAFEALPAGLLPGSPRNLDVATLLLDPASRGSLPEGSLKGLEGALAYGMHGVFLALLVTALLGALIVLRLPGGRPAEVGQETAVARKEPVEAETGEG